MVVRVFPWKTHNRSFSIDSCLLRSQLCKDCCGECRKKKKDSLMVTHNIFTIFLHIMYLACVQSDMCEIYTCVCDSPVPCHLPVFLHEPSLVFLWQRNMWGCYSTARLSSPKRVAAKICFLEHTSRREPASGEAGEEYPQPAEKRASGSLCYTILWTLRVRSSFCKHWGRNRNYKGRNSEPRHACFADIMSQTFSWFFNLQWIQL